MEPEVFNLILVLGVLFLLLISGLHIYLVLGVAGAMALILTGSMYKTMGNMMWFTTASWDLSTLPLFLLMGQIILTSGISESLYRFAGHLLAVFPGKLLLSNVFASALFATVSGSSAATAAAVGSVAFPEQTKLGYDKKLVMGSIAASGTLGILIPPSINMIIYSIFTKIPLGTLFIAGFLPGALLALLFAVYVAFVCWKNPRLTPREVARYPFKQALSDFKRGMIPLIVLFGIIWGGIFSGWMTPTESAGVAVVAAYIFAAINRRLSPSTIQASLLSTLRVTGMIMAIMIGAKFVSVAVAYMGIAETMVSLVTSVEIAPLAILFIIYGVYLLLGCFLDGISMMLLTLPFVVPIIEQSGFGLLWFGIVLIVWIEVSVLTPPVGLNLFVVMGMAHATLNEVVKSVLPFLVILVVMILILTFFPDLVTLLPNAMS